MFNPFRLLVKLWHLLFGSKKLRKQLTDKLKQKKTDTPFTYRPGASGKYKRLETGFWAEAHLSARTMYNRRKRGRV